MSPAPARAEFPSVIWIEGLPGAGKTTVAAALKSLLEREGRKVAVLDGEELRRTTTRDLGFSRKDRETHARRVSLLAKERTAEGTIAIVALVTPYETGRRAARAAVGPGFVEVWLRCPIEVCRQRDPHGIFSLAEGGKLDHVTGVDDPWEDPLDPEITVDTDRRTADESARQIFDQLHRRPSMPPLVGAPA